MFKARRFSIAWLMVVVLFVATDFAILRAAMNTVWEAIAAITLPMINILLMAAPRLRRGCSGRPFCQGFVAAGGLMAILFGGLAGLASVGVFDDAFFFPIDWINGYHLFPPASTSNAVWILWWVVVFYSTPQLLVAMASGWFTSKYQITITRRPIPEELVR